MVNKAFYYLLTVKLLLANFWLTINLPFFSDGYHKMLSINLEQGVWCVQLKDVNEFHYGNNKTKMPDVFSLCWFDLEVCLCHKSPSLR